MNVEDLKDLLDLEGVSYEDISDEDLELLLQTKINELSGLTNLPLESTNHKDIVRGFDGDIYEVDHYPLGEVSSFTIGSTTLSADDYVCDNERGILYLNTLCSGMLVIEYSSKLSDDFVTKNINPLLFDMVKYGLTTGFSKDGVMSSMKEGDVQVNYDTSSSLGNLIYARINNLKGAYSPRIRML